MADAIAREHGLEERGDWHGAIEKVLQDMGVAPPHGREPLDADLVARVAGALTVPETFFMRHHTQFARVTEHLLDRLPRAAAPLGVLSAGCSTGEEPYSLVLCLMRALGEYAPEHIHVHACDISAEAIAKATSGAYGNWSFRNVPGWLMERHFDQIDTGRYCLGSAIRDRVRFQCRSIANRVAEFPDASLDAVLFRNVGIYLSTEHLSHLFAEFRRVLRPDGLLIVAPSDPRPPRISFERTDHESTGVYRHRDEGTPLAATRGERRHRPAATCASDRTAPSSNGAAAQLPLPEPGAIRALADCGDVARAIEFAEARVAKDPSDPEAHLLAGQMHLAGARAQDREVAIGCMRRAVFLAPANPLARFWYAHALIADDRLKMALAQLEALGAILEQMPDERRLDDGQVSVAELREARTFLLEGVQ